MILNFSEDHPVLEKEDFLSSNERKSLAKKIPCRPSQLNRYNRSSGGSDESNKANILIQSVKSVKIIGEGDPKENNKYRVSCHP